MIVSNSLEQTKADLRVKSTKSGELRRFVLPPSVLPLLAAHRAQQDEDKRLYGPDYQDHGLIVSVRPTTSFQVAPAFDAVGVWTNTNNDPGGGEAVKTPTDWRPNGKRAGSANGSSAISAECR